MVTLASPISSIKTVTAEMSERFAHLGIQTLQDALLHFPIRHEDWRVVVPFQNLVPDTKVTVVGSLVKIQTRRAWRRRAVVTEAVMEDEAGHRLRVTWYNQPYLTTWLKPGQRYFLSGRVVARKGAPELQQPVFQRVQADSLDPAGARLTTGRDRPIHERLVPIYPTTGGLSQWQLRKVLRQAVKLAALMADPLPAALRQQYDLVPLTAALQQIHFPAGPAEVAQALHRLKFDELLAWQMAWRRAHIGTGQSAAPAIPFDAHAVRRFVQSLPFELTNDQRQAAWDILQDLQRTKPMSRLVQGDVGSGKTVVAAIAALNTIQAHHQVTLLAPTVVLAQQHADTLQQLFLGQDLTIGFLSGSQARLNGRPVEASTLKARLRDGQLDFVVATHAVLAPGLAWKNLGLVIVDEQQRFGVRQRQALLDVTRQSSHMAPHFLSLTATPIPRTLALTVAGELQISSLRHKPPGRQPIATQVVTPANRKLVDTAIQATVQHHGQVYVITPLIEESDALGVRAATTEYDRLREKFPHIRVGIVHGNLAADQRIEVLEQFRRGAFNLLVSTTVIEVGIDVPNATLMIIEGAERFGLSQLHQLRGRVGRGQLPSQCLLVTDQAESHIIKRLARVAASQDGFEIAELDLERRGGGDVYGVRQSGLPAWKLATLQDAVLFAETRAAADQLLQAPPSSPEARAVKALLGMLPPAHRE